MWRALPLKASPRLATGLIYIHVLSFIQPLVASYKAAVQSLPMLCSPSIEPGTFRSPIQTECNFSVTYTRFFKENVRYPVWTCRDPIFSDSRDPIFNSRARIGSLKRLKKNLIITNSPTSTGCWSAVLLPRNINALHNDRVTPHCVVFCPCLAMRPAPGGATLYVEMCWTPTKAHSMRRTFLENPLQECFLCYSADGFFGPFEVCTWILLDRKPVAKWTNEGKSSLGFEKAPASEHVRAGIDNFGWIV